ncbi:MAG TPA: FtsQ-type POTRA domain-containing protein [Pyrinomonadaceae bacterium]|nr:FtsQ-type POTRA domain-containing protein [Pyrinomonadaceae bacterium]
MANTKANISAKKAGPASRVNVKRPLKRGRTSTGKRRNSQAGPSRFRAFSLPLFLSFCILICLGALSFLGYQTVTASDFFNVARVDVTGTERSSSSDIRRLVEMQTEKSGVWNADLPVIKEKLERLQWVKTAAVSRVLPNGIRVQIFERQPEALVRTSDGAVLVDAEGVAIAPAREKEPEFPFAITGWNQAKSEPAGKENLERVKVYRKMLAEWKEFDLSSRVVAVNLEDLREPRAIVEDSGTVVSIALGRDKFAEYLKRGINAIVGKGDMFEAVNLVGQNMILAPRKNSQQ